MLASKLIASFENNEQNPMLQDLYLDASQTEMQKARYIALLKRFIEIYGDKEVSLFTSAGRTEVSGNHTDHQHGRVLAASINLDTIAVAAKTKDVIKVVSDAYDIPEVPAHKVAPEEVGEGTSEALIAGVVAGFENEGWNVGGFEAVMTSTVLAGSGLSSSASFEVMIGTILNAFYNDNLISTVDIARVSQYAENVYFGKPCGLMDQCACAVGGLITIDFKDPSAPEVRAINTDFDTLDLVLCITDTKGSHADLTHEYAAIPEDMKAVAACFGKDVLREVDPQAFYAGLAELREKVSDRAVLRAIHFFSENERVAKAAADLEAGDKEAFLEDIQASGDSSFKYLQNVFAASDPANQGVSLGLAVSEQALEGKGVSRVHGGGFAGTIQAFVASEQAPAYQKAMDALFGEGSCHLLKIRPVGGSQIL